MRKGETMPDELRNQFTKKTASDMMPREQQMRATNPRQVSDEDLLAVLLRTGSHGCNVKELSRRRQMQETDPFADENWRENFYAERNMEVRG